MAFAHVFPSMPATISIFAVLLCAALLPLCRGQQPEPNGVDKKAQQKVEPGSNTFNKRMTATCKPVRTIDGTCTNSEMKYWGSIGLAQFSYYKKRSSTVPTGAHLPSARYVSNAICRQTADMPNRRKMSEFVTFFGQFLDHCIVATPKNSQKMPIPVPKGDTDALSVFSSGQMPFSRSKRAHTSERMDVEHPINTLSSAIDLAAVYGPDTQRLNKLRTFKDGLMKTSTGNNLPLNTMGLSNAPSTSPLFFAAGDQRANENPVLISIHTLFLREHNKLAGELKAVFPAWGEEKLFQTARACNIAQFQKAVFENFYPTMTGRFLPGYVDFKPEINPTLSDVFTTVAFRIGHTLVGDVIQRRGKNFSLMSPLSPKDMFFKPKSYRDGGGLEAFIRGALDHRAQEVDIFVSDSLRNFLFKEVPNEAALDLVALNLQRGRDHAIPSYVSLRRKFRRNKPRGWKGINPNPNVYKKLKKVYRKVKDVEAFIGLLAEPHVRGASMGKTMLNIWKKEFKRIRDGDRFFYKRKNFIFDKQTRDGFKTRLDEIYGDLDIMRTIIARNSDIDKTELPPSIWFKY